MNQWFSWRYASVVLFALLSLMAVLYRQAILYLVNLWNQIEIGEYAHGYLVLLISIYLVFVNRSRLLHLSPCPEYRALPAVFVASQVWLLAALVNIEVLQSVGLLLLLMSVLWVVLGTQVSKILAFPVLYIGFAIPVWFPLSPLLQELTADVVFWLIRLMEVPAFRDGNIIVLPAGRMSVEEACSGLRYLLAALTLGTLYGYLNYVTMFSRLLVVLISIAAAVLVNILRVFIVVYLGFSTDMEHPLVYDHLFFGWYLFAGLVLFLFVGDALLQKKLAQNGAKSDITMVEDPSLCHKGKFHILAAISVATSLVIVAPLLLYWENNQTLIDNELLKVELPSVLPGWIKVVVNDDWTPEYNGAVTKKATYADANNRQAYLYLGMYPKQEQGKELINELNSIADNKTWHRQYQSVQSIEVGENQVLEQLLINNQGKQRLVWYWYRVAGKDTINKYSAKKLQLLGYITGMRQASIIAIATTLEKDKESTRELLRRFKLAIVPVSDGVYVGGSLKKRNAESLYSIDKKSL